MKIPEHLLKFWVHRLTKCDFKQGYGTYYNSETGCRCAVGTLLPFDARKHFKDDLGYSIAYIAKYSMFLDTDTDGSIIDLNDVVQLSFEEIAKKLEEVSKTLEFLPNFINHLEKIYQAAIANGEYSETA